MEDKKTVQNQGDTNPDPISGEPGAHPVGTGIGAAGAGAIGTAIGAALGGPVGAVAGAVVGSVVGGLAGKATAEAIDPTVENAYWRDNYATEKYVEKDLSYDEYEPAYRTGYKAYRHNFGTGKTYEQLEPELQSDYESNRGGSSLTWEKAKHATRAAWDRAERALPGDIDRDGR